MIAKHGLCKLVNKITGNAQWAHYVAFFADVPLLAR
jgi:hypothetical protein